MALSSKRNEKPLTLMHLFEISNGEILWSRSLRTLTVFRRALSWQQTSSKLRCDIYGFLKPMRFENRQLRNRTARIVTKLGQKFLRFDTIVACCVFLPIAKCSKFPVLFDNILQLTRI